MEETGNTGDPSQEWSDLQNSSRRSQKNRTGHKPSKTSNVVLVGPQSAAGIPNHVLSSRGYFFDNPRRYDSDDDLAWSVPPHNASARY